MTGRTEKSWDFLILKMKEKCDGEEERKGAVLSVSHIAICWAVKNTDMVLALE